MKKHYLNQLMLIFLMGIVSVLVACTDDDPKEPDVLIPSTNGVYVFGSNTVAKSALEPAAKMSLATLNPDKSGGAENADGYYGKLIYIGANSTIQISYVDGDVSTTYGAEGGGTITSGLELDFTDIDADIINGDLVADGTPINVADEGLYKLFVDMNTESFRLMKLEPNLIGDATPGNWQTSTALPLKAASATGASFEMSNLGLFGASGYKIRFNKGYELYNDGVIATIDYLGVADYQAAWDAGVNDLVYKDVNLPNRETGLFTYTLAFDAATVGWSETKTKTGDMFKDYSGLQIGWFGNGYLVDGAEPANQWADVHMALSPEKTNLIYSWKWTVDLIKDRSFVLRDPEGTVWITWGGAGKTGSSFDNMEFVKEADDKDNYLVVNGGKYDVTFTINAEDDGRTINIEPVPSGDGPSIASFSPVFAKAGDQLTLKGMNLATATVTVGDAAATIVSQSAEEIVLTVPSGLTSGVNAIKVTEGEDSFTAKTPFSVVSSNTKVTLISDFEEADVANVWGVAEDAGELAANEFLNSMPGNGYYYHLKGADANGNYWLGGRYAGSNPTDQVAFGLTENDAAKVYYNVDIRSNAGNGMGKLVFEVTDASQASNQLNWEQDFSVTWGEWKRISIAAEDFHRWNGSGFDMFSGNINTVWTVALYLTGGSSDTYDLSWDNVTFSEGEPLGEVINF